ncbi:MAG: epoxide hydrolase [Chloroflexi bacterium]|nr:epoxide hydrolase [Chloroflexota bacterium]
MQPEPFSVHIDDEVLEDLQNRLAATRWPNELPRTGWDYGSNLDYMKELVDYWRNEFDWRAQEALINSFSHYKADVEGLGIHFIHERGNGPNPMPLVITHGWPGTFFEMYKLIPLLTDPASHGGDSADSFDVVAPSLPGFGFSDYAQERGMEVARTAALWEVLMTQHLGYPRFAAHGGDIGAGVTSRLGYGHADSLFGIHLTSITRPVPYLGDGARELTDAEKTHMREREEWQQSEGGYAHIQGTKPQTLAYGLNDSPVGLAAWIVEKYRTWSDCGGDVEKRFTKDELLTTITIYWATETITSSTRMYKENQRYTWTLTPDERIEVPTGVAAFPAEISRPPREWGERSYNLQSWTPMPSGGHFAALEEPQILAEDIRQFFRPLRNS